MPRHAGNTRRPSRAERARRAAANRRRQSRRASP